MDKATIRGREWTAVEALWSSTEACRKELQGVHCLLFRTTICGLQILDDVRNEFKAIVEGGQK